MKVQEWVAVLVAGLFSLAGMALRAQQKGSVQLLTEDQTSKIVPASVFVEGENAPVQKRNAAAARLPDGKLFVVALIDTSGFSAAYQQKYVGVLLAQGALRLGNLEVKPGAYGLGTRKRTSGARETLAFVLYDLGGNPLAEIPAQKDASLRPVRPLQVRVDMPAARFYLGLDYVTISPL